eukprot:SAG31_NODE_2498_length_5598_cov_2.801600_5_plen_77_part_00
MVSANPSCVLDICICMVQVSVSATGDPGTTGNFEVTANGKLAHSKTTMGHLGHGKCTDAAEQQRLIDVLQVCAVLS